MNIVEKYRAFFTKKRSWRWLAAGLVLVIAGHLLEGVHILSGLQAITARVSASLHAVQPFTIADTFYEAIRGHRGLWFCSPVGDEHPCGSVFGMANMGIASLLAVPRVGVSVWHDGGLLAIILFGLTIVGIVFAIISTWQEANAPGGSGGQALIGTIALLAFGPIIAGAVFWLLLQFLLLLTFVFGAVLSGITWLIATFGFIYKFATFLMEGVKTGDELQENAELLIGKAPPPEA